MFESFDFQQMISAFIVLFAVIDIIGSIPIIINLKEKGKDVNAMKATVISFLLMIGFFYAGSKLAQGRDAVKELLKDNPELAEEIEAKVREKIAEGASKKK